MDRASHSFLNGIIFFFFPCNELTWMLFISVDHFCFFLWEIIKYFIPLSLSFILNYQFKNCAVKSNLRILVAKGRGQKVITKVKDNLFTYAVQIKNISCDNDCVYIF